MDYHLIAYIQFLKQENMLIAYILTRLASQHKSHIGDASLKEEP